MSPDTVHQIHVLAPGFLALVFLGLASLDERLIQKRVFSLFDGKEKPSMEEREEIVRIAVSALVSAGYTANILIAFMNILLSILMHQGFLLFLSMFCLALMTIIAIYTIVSLSTLKITDIVTLYWGPQFVQNSHFLRLAPDVIASRLMPKPISKWLHIEIVAFHLLAMFFLVTGLYLAHPKQIGRAHV